jgi:hypothetical protein
MIALHWETEIRASAERVFALLADLDPQGSVKLVMPLVLRAFRAENARMMSVLKDYAERAENADLSARETAGQQ